MGKFDLTFIKKLLDMSSEDRNAFYKGTIYMELSAEEKKELDNQSTKEFNSRVGEELVKNLNANVNAKYLEYRKEMLQKIREHNIEVMFDTDPLLNMGSKAKVYMTKPEKNFFLCETNSGFDAGMIVDALRHLADDDLIAEDIDQERQTQERKRYGQSYPTNRPRLSVQEQESLYKKFSNLNSDELEEYFMSLSRLEKVQAIQFVTSRKKVSKLLWRMWSPDYYEYLEGSLEHKYNFRAFLLSQLFDPNNSIVVLPIVDSNTLSRQDCGIYIETPNSFIGICQGSAIEISIIKEALNLWIIQEKPQKHEIGEE